LSIFLVKRTAKLFEANGVTCLYSEAGFSICEMPRSAKANYVFISGKNWKLSLAELIAFLEARKVQFKVQQISREFFVTDVEDGASALAIANLGGILKIGAVTADFPTQIVEKAFLQKDKQAREQIRRETAASGAVAEMLETAPVKTVFGVSVYCAEDSLRPVSKSIQRFVGSSIKRELTAHGRKASFMGFSKDREKPQLSHVEVLKKNFVENKAETLFCIGKKQTVVATTVAVHNPFEFQKRDLDKPMQRKIFAISPRLAKIMVNLASCTSGKLFVDPFCGVGTILQEALLAQARVVGVDINPWCVKAAKANLEWLKREYSLEGTDYAVVKGDALRLAEKLGEEVDCIVTEPDLGPALRQVPTAPYAAKVTGRLEPLYWGFLEEAYSVLKKGGRLVLVAPYMRTRSGKPVTMPVGDKAVNIGFKRVYLFQEKVFAEEVEVKREMAEMASFVDAEERHKVGREIFVFQK
jgi:tRNA G10  N-methylase Trm11